MRNITFRADYAAIERARKLARSENKTLDDAFREWLEAYASRNDKVTTELQALFDGLRHVRAGRKFTRDEMNQR